MKNKRNISLSKEAYATTPYVFSFKDVSTNDYAEALNVLFDDEDFRVLTEKRNRYVRAVEKLHARSSERMSMIMQIQAADRKLADFMLACIARANANSLIVKENFSFSHLLRYFVDYSKDRNKENAELLTRNLFSMTFLADVIESVLAAIDCEMQQLFGHDVKFEQFDAIRSMLKHFKTFFKQVYEKDMDSPVSQLYFEYSDSITEYMKKRMKTYNDRLSRLIPFERVFTEDEMIDALNQFFGTEDKFGKFFIKHTAGGGCHIDSMALLSNIGVLETEKLEKELSKRFEITTKSIEKYDMYVTDVIVDAYRPNPK